MNSAAQLPTPRRIGRSVRFFLGAVLIFFFAQLLLFIPHVQSFLAARPSWSVPGGNWWIAAMVCFMALGVVVNRGFGRHWDAWPQIVFLSCAGAAVIWDRLVYGGLWAMPLAVLVLLLVGYVLAHAGISYVVAAVAGTPG